jgi:hypothetical protein
MSSNVKIGLYTVGSVVGLGLLTLGGIYVNGFSNDECKTPQTEVFQESQAYTDGMKLLLDNLFLEYQKADTPGKIGISNVVRDVFTGVDTTSFPPYLQQFLVTVGAR